MIPLLVRSAKEADNDTMRYPLSAFISKNRSA